MKKTIILLVALLLTGLLVIPAFAAGPSSYESTVSVTNVTGTPGFIRLTYYNSNGTVAAYYDDSIDAYESIIYTSLPGISTSFDGSMVITSSVPVVSSSMVIGKDDLDGVMNYSSYIGVSVGSPTVNLPLLMDSNWGFSTYFSIMNTSNAAVDVDIAYTDGTTNSVTGLMPGASVTIDNQAETHAQTVFAATLTSTGGDIAAVVVEWGDGSYGKPLYAYNGFSSGSPSPIFAMVNENNYNYWTSLQVQNIGDVATTVTLQYTPNAAGAPCTETRTIGAGEMSIFASYAFAYDIEPTTSNCAFGETFVGVATVLSNSTNQPLVGIINQLLKSEANEGDKGAALDSLNPQAATPMVVYPEVYGYYGAWHWFSSITIFNVSGFELPAGDVTCRVIGSYPGGPVDSEFSNDTPIANGEGWLEQFWSGWVPAVPDDFLGSIRCTSAQGLLLGTSNILGHAAPPEIDSLAVYEGINVTP